MAPSLLCVRRCREDLRDFAQQLADALSEALRAGADGSHMKFTGWQRLWISISLILIVPVTAVTWLFVPSDDPIKAAWAKDVLATVKERDGLEWTSVLQVKRVLFDGLDDDGIIRKARLYAEASYAAEAKKNPREVPLMLLDMALAEQWYGRQLEHLQALQKRRIAIGGTVWLVMVVLVYGIVRSAHWLGPRFRGASGNSADSV
jgi:hypothetical protein